MSWVEISAAAVHFFIYLLQSGNSSTIHVCAFDFIQQGSKVHGKQEDTPAGRQETNVSRPS
jgi:hypothetical protein